MFYKQLILLCISATCFANPMTLHRVIVSSDKNPMYLDFWPFVAKAWKQIVGLQPTLILIDTEEGLEVDETVGDVIRIKPIEGVPSWQHAQIIRAFAPMLFPNEVCMISDMDVLPMNKDYFFTKIKRLQHDNFFVVYRDKAYANNSRYPMWFLAAKGSIYQEIVGVDWQGVEEAIKQWVAEGYGWDTDELVFTKYINKWHETSRRCMKLGYGGMEQRIDRSSWHYNENLLKKGYYHYSHMIRPYSQYKDELDKLFHLIGLQ